MRIYRPRGYLLAAIRHLQEQPGGARLSANELADAVGCALPTMYTVLMRGADSRFLVRVKRDGGTGYGLGPVTVPAEEDTLPVRQTVVPAGAMPEPERFAAGDGRNLRLTVWSGGASVYEGGELRQLNQAQREALLEAVDRVRAAA